MSGVELFVCTACGHIVFPARLLCPNCGGSGWREEVVHTGVVEETTVVRRAPGRAPDEPVRLGAVRLEHGVVLIARLEPGIGAKDAVRLSQEHGVPVASRAR